MIIYKRFCDPIDSNPNLQNRNLKFYPLNYGAKKSDAKLNLSADLNAAVCCPF